MPSVVFATKRGRELGCGVPSGVVEVGAEQVRTNYKKSSPKNIPFSGTLGGAGTPGTLFTENLANETGLNPAGFFTEPLCVWFLPSDRLASDSEPPCEAVSSPPSDAEASPLSSRTRVATTPAPCLEVSCAYISKCFGAHPEAMLTVVEPPASLSPAAFSPRESRVFVFSWFC